MLVLTETDLKELNSFIQEMPLKYGLPLLNYINAKIAEKTKSETSKKEEDSENSSEPI